MSALNPTRKIGRMAAEVIESRGIRYATVKDEFERRLAMGGLPERVLDLYPMELSGGMKQRVVMILSTLLDPRCSSPTRSPQRWTSPPRRPWPRPWWACGTTGS
jgi:ABC-type glutathione transport system ATPase component